MNFQIELEQVLQLADRSEAYQRLAALFLNGPEELRNLVRAKWDFGVKWTYPNTQRLACRKNERYSCEERIVATLIYDAIENLRSEDMRDKLVAWAVVYHSCHATGIVPDEQFSRVASISSPSIAQAMTDFINRPEEDKSMNAFMLVERKNVDGETEILPSWHK
jgi:hypothetical protein